MHYTLLDCYTDEAAGLGVPPYLGTYPRYIYGKLCKEGHKVSYLTIDVKGRLPLKKRIKVKVVGHMLRSIVGEVVENNN